MAAKLEWKRKGLLLDGKEVGRVKRWGVGGWGYALHVGATRIDSEPEAYELEDDARQDLEAEVRRLLKEAGVDVQ